MSRFRWLFQHNLSQNAIIMQWSVGQLCKVEPTLGKRVRAAGLRPKLPDAHSPPIFLERQQRGNWIGMRRPARNKRSLMVSASKHSPIVQVCLWEHSHCRISPPDNSRRKCHVAQKPKAAQSWWPIGCAMLCINSLCCEAEQIIHAEFDRGNNFELTYPSGMLKEPLLNSMVLEALKVLSPPSEIAETSTSPSDNADLLRC
jgi:hypothetical protein